MHTGTRSENLCILGISIPGSLARGRLEVRLGCRVRFGAIYKGLGFRVYDLDLETGLLDCICRSLEDIYTCNNGDALVL